MARPAKPKQPTEYPKDLFKQSEGNLYQSTVVDDVEEQIARDAGFQTITELYGVPQ